MFAYTLNIFCLEGSGARFMFSVLRNIQLVRLWDIVLPATFPILYRPQRGFIRLSRHQLWVLISADQNTLCYRSQTKPIMKREVYDFKSRYPR